MIIFDYIFYIIFDTLWALPLIVILWFVWPVIWRKQGRPFSNKRRLILSLFIFYLAMVINATIPFFNLYESFKYQHIAVHGVVNLIPFLEIRHFLSLWQEGGGGAAALNLLGNILMFLPLGFFLPWLFKKFRRFWPTVIVAALFSASIELIQSFSFRGADVDDVILNTVGALVGYFLYRLVSKKNR